jgi:hypothetical protein
VCKEDIAGEDVLVVVIGSVSPVKCLNLERVRLKWDGR